MVYTGSDRVRKQPLKSLRFGKLGRKTRLNWDEMLHEEPGIAFVQADIELDVECKRYTARITGRTCQARMEYPSVYPECSKECPDYREAKVT